MCWQNDFNTSGAYRSTIWKLILDGIISVDLKSKSYHDRCGMSEEGHKIKTALSHDILQEENYVSFLVNF